MVMKGAIVFCEVFDLKKRTHNWLHENFSFMEAQEAFKDWRFSPPHRLSTKYTIGLHTETTYGLIDASRDHQRSTTPGFGCPWHMGSGIQCIPNGH